MPQLIFDALVLFITTAICLLAYLKKSLTAGGTLLALLIAVVLYWSGGVFFLAVLLAFFLSSTLISRLKSAVKKEIERDLHAKTGTRDIAQVGANGGAAFLCAVFYLWLREDALVAAFCAALAACNADTWASEIGVLSRSVPVLITTFRPVQRGISGGVTFLGVLASAAGAVFIAGVYAVFHVLYLPLGAVFWNAVVISGAGVFGSFADSFLGDTLQAKYITKAKQLTEKPQTGGEKNKLIKGMRWMTNDAVNFISSAAAALFGYAIIKILFG